MPRYFEKAKEVDAMQFDGTLESANRIFEWLKDLGVRTVGMHFLRWADETKGRLVLREKYFGVEGDYIVVEDDQSSGIFDKETFEKLYGKLVDETNSEEN